MRLAKYAAVIAVVAMLAGSVVNVRAGYYGRQYYGSWSYYPERTYYYRSYYYQPYSGADYSYHYCIYYPSQPNYAYYYNPYQHYYWGRLDLRAKGEEKYSLLKEEDRKDNLKDIPEKAFPKPAKMPNIPESKDGVAIEPIKADDLPKETK